MKCFIVVLKRKLELEDVFLKKFRIESLGASGKVIRYVLKLIKKYKNGLVIKGNIYIWVFKYIYV